MTKQGYIAVVLSVLVLAALLAANHPGAILAAARPPFHAADWATSRLRRMISPPRECPWTPECI